MPMRRRRWAAGSAMPREDLELVLKYRSEATTPFMKDHFPEYLRSHYRSRPEDACRSRVTVGLICGMAGPDGISVGRNPRNPGGNDPRSLPPPRRVASAVTPAPSGQAAAAARIIECPNTHEGCSDTHNHRRRDRCGTWYGTLPKRHGLFPYACLLRHPRLTIERQDMCHKPRQRARNAAAPQSGTAAPPKINSSWPRNARFCPAKWLEAVPSSWLRWASVWVLKAIKRMFH
jgi:hypothetical protein